MALINQEDINNIRSSIDIIDVVGNYLPLTQRGKNYFGVCPFHDDHSPSMSVSKEKQIYTCFSCGATGNVFNFIMDYEHISFIEAVKIVADKAGINVDIKASSEKVVDNVLYDIYDISAKFFINNINSSDGQAAKSYLANRQLDDSIIKEFGVGLALKEKDALTKFLFKKNYDSSDLLKTGLVNKSEQGFYDIYYHRIMFPLWDLSGRIVGYSGRIYNGEDHSKYINTKETEIFKKGELLYNYHRAKDQARKTDVIIVMEGFMDVIRAHTIGVTNVVATMGTAVTKEQASLIKRMAKKVILCFDGDEAGAKATFACANELIKIGVVPSVVRLIGDMDPDDYIVKRGAEAFLKEIGSPISLMEFKMSYLKGQANLDNSIDLSKYVSSVLDEINKLDDDILKEISLQKLSKDAKLDISFLRDKIIKKEIKYQEPVKKIKKNKYEKAELRLLYHMMHHPEVITIVSKNGLFMPTEEYRHLMKQVIAFYKTYNYFNIADFISTFDSKDPLIKLIGEIDANDFKETYFDEEISDYIKVINEYNSNYVINRFEEKIRNSKDAKERAEFLNEIIKIKKRSEEND